MNRIPITIESKSLTRRGTMREMIGETRVEKSEEKTDKVLLNRPGRPPSFRNVLCPHADDPTMHGQPK
jgi:hypothetical protein